MTAEKIAEAFVDIIAVKPAHIVTRLVLHLAFVLKLRSLSCRQPRHVGHIRRPVEDVLDSLLTPRLPRSQRVNEVEVWRIVRSAEKEGERVCVLKSLIDALSG